MWRFSKQGLSMDPAVFAPFNPPQPNGGLYRPQYNGAGNSSVNAGGDHHRRPRFPSGGPTMSNTMSASNLPQVSWNFYSLHFLTYEFSNWISKNAESYPCTLYFIWTRKTMFHFIFQGSKLATYMNRGNGNPNFNNTGNMSQLATDLNNLGLDPGTLKKLSMSGIREFIPPNSGGGNGGGGAGGPPPTSTGMHQGSPGDVTNSGSSSPFQPRLQPPPASGTHGSQFGNSPRASPTPSSSSMSSMMQQQPQSAASLEASDPSSIATYSDGGTTYFYSSEADMVWCIQIHVLYSWCKATVAILEQYCQR